MRRRRRQASSASSTRGPAAAAGAAMAAVPGGGGGGGTVNFCPQCGKKVEATFIFCPSCGNRLPLQEEEAMQITPSPSLQELNQKGLDALSVAVTYPPMKKVVINLPDKEKASTSVKRSSTQIPASPKPPMEVVQAKPALRSPKKNKAASVIPLPEGEVLTDLSDKKWKLVRLLSQSDCGLMYEAESASGAGLQKQRFSLKLDARDGRLFNEQNFLQRAAKKTTVEKWKKQHSVPLLGIPNCVGFGLYGSDYSYPIPRSLFHQVFYFLRWVFRFMNRHGVVVKSTGLLSGNSLLGSLPPPTRRSLLGDLGQVTASLSLTYLTGCVCCGERNGKEFVSHFEI